MLPVQLEDVFKAANLEQYMEDDAVLDQTRKVRLSILHDQLKNGIPNTTDEFEMLHKNLQELDKQALKKKQIMVDSDSAMVNAAFIKQITDSIVENTGTKDRHAIGGGAIPNVDDQIPEIPLIDGELEVGVVHLTYDNFMANEGKIIAEQKAKEDA